MKQMKRLALRIFFGVEIFVFIFFYFFGPHGFQALQQRAHENELLAMSVAQVTQEITQLKHELELWKTKDFYKEKVARDQLQMARKGDEIYYLT